MTKKVTHKDQMMVPVAHISMMTVPIQEVAQVSYSIAEVTNAGFGTKPSQKKMTPVVMMLQTHAIRD